MAMKRFENREVVGAAMKIVRAGDGLSEALSLSPEMFKSGETVTVVLEGEIGDIIYKRVRDTDAFRRVHVLVTERIVRIPSEDAAGYFDAEAKRLAALRDEKDGVSRLPLGDDPLNVFGGTPATPEQAAEEAAAEASEAG